MSIGFYKTDKRMYACMREMFQEYGHKLKVRRTADIKIYPMSRVTKL